MELAEARNPESLHAGSFWLPHGHAAPIGRAIAKDVSRRRLLGTWRARPGVGPLLCRWQSRRAAAWVHSLRRRRRLYRRGCCANYLVGARGIVSEGEIHFHNRAEKIHLVLGRADVHLLAARVRA